MSTFPWNPLKLIESFNIFHQKSPKKQGGCGLKGIIWVKLGSVL